MGKTQWLADFARSSWQTKVMRKMLDAEKYDALRHSFYEKSYGKPILDSATVNRQLREKLKNGEPFAVTRKVCGRQGYLPRYSGILCGIRTRQQGWMMYSLTGGRECVIIT